MRIAHDFWPLSTVCITLGLLVWIAISCIRSYCGLGAAGILLILAYIHAGASILAIGTYAYRQHKTSHPRTTILLSTTIAIATTPLTFHVFSTSYRLLLRTTLEPFASTQALFGDTFSIGAMLSWILLSAAIGYGAGAWISGSKKRLGQALTVVVAVILLASLTYHGTIQERYECQELGTDCLTNIALANDDITICETHLLSNYNSRRGVSSCTSTYAQEKATTMEECRQLRHSDPCSQEIARKLAQPDICDGLSEEWGRTSCYNDIARNTNNLIICERITNNGTRTECKDHIYTARAAQHVDPWLCENVSYDNRLDCRKRVDYIQTVAEYKSRPESQKCEFLEGREITAWLVEKCDTARNS